MSILKLSFLIFPEVGENGEVLFIHNITRYCGGLYECEAQNGIGTGVRRSINVDVECKIFIRFDKCL